jgi:hypothetical protein
MFKLYGVSETPNKSGWFPLVSFDNDTFNQIVDEDEIEDTLARLVRVLYGRGGKKNCHEITKNMCNNGTISIYIDWDKRLKIQNIIEKISVPPMRSRFFIVVNTECKKCQWVVATLQCTVYSDEENDDETE